MTDWAAVYQELIADPVEPVPKRRSIEPERQEMGGIPLLAASLATLERCCPDHIETDVWQRAVEGGRRFLTQWGKQAIALGWTEADVFGLPEVPANPHPRWHRLARVDQLGLVWLLCGRRVTAISAETAAIATSSGGALAFRRRVKHLAANG